MKHYAIFYHLRDGRYVEGCGDRSVLRLDARNTLRNMRLDAIDWGKRHGFDGYSIKRGDNLLRLFDLTTVAPIESV